MQQVTSSTSIESNAPDRETLVELLIVGALAALSVAVYAFLFNRANVLSHSIGYNLYAAQRVLEGGVPYRDFHTLYPPATLYLNAILFKWLGVSLYSALAGVFVFKVMTITFIYTSSRQVLPRTLALICAASSLLWLRPNGPFKSVPMHYGALFLALAMYLLLKNESRERLIVIALAGASLGMVALFKHNIGAYALLGSVVILAAEDSTFRYSLGALARSYKRIVVLVGGCVAVIAPVLAYMYVRGALRPMIGTLFFGPGEFLLSRIAIPLSPVAPVVLIIAIAICAWAIRISRDRAPIAVSLWLILIAAITIFLLRGNHADVNQVIFYLPMIVLGIAILVAIFDNSLAVRERRGMLIVFVFGAAALMEVFPRFAREQTIAAMPFVMLVLFYVLCALRPAAKRFFGASVQYRFALAILPITFVLIEGRLFFNTYLDGNLRFKASTPVTAERVHGVYFPPSTAAVIDQAVNYIQTRVPPGGYAFAQSDSGSSLLFLADRRNVSSAQFWIGVGVSPEQRAATLARIDNNRIKLIITSDEIVAAEKYEPMRDYINRNFKASTRFDDVLILER